MLEESLASKIKHIEIKTREVVNATLSGEYHSVFKGQGLNFAEVREYQEGDDVRLIDWNVTAKAGKPFIKIFEEERELTVYLVVDISASGQFGTLTQSKVDVAAEIAALLGFSAIKNNDQVGLLLFSNHVEKYIPPKKGKKHILRILRDIFSFKPQHKTTSISTALKALLRHAKKKSIIFVISDFMDHDYDIELKLLAKKHDVVPIVLRDPKEETLPDAGILCIEDFETNQIFYVNTSAKDTREKFKAMTYAKRLSLERLFKSIKLTPIFLTVGESYVKHLVHYFKSRAKF